MIARVCLLSFVSINVLAAIDGRRISRQTSVDANNFCSWLRGNKLKNCLAHPLLGLSAREGVELALKECRKQFTDRRWNCSGVTIADVFQNERMLKTDSKDKSTALYQTLRTTIGKYCEELPPVRHTYGCHPHPPNDGSTLQGFHPNTAKESSYLHALSAAGVAHQITMDCSKGTREECGCDNRPQGRGGKPGEKSWEWGGCSEDYRYGSDFSKKFMDPSKTTEKSLSAFLIRHNNEAGRKVIKDKMDKSCKCHGVSGSCTVRVCWKSMPKMTVVATELRRKFEQALKVKLNRSKTKLTRLSRGRRGRKTNRRNPNRRPPLSSLVYSENSPNYCTPEPKYGILGTYRRSCNKTSSGTDGCRHMCCGRGYNTVNRVDDVKCNCQFIWCCHVKCDWCKKEWVQHTCK